MFSHKTKWQCLYTSYNNSNNNRREKMYRNIHSHARNEFPVVFLFSLLLVRTMIYGGARERGARPNRNQSHKKRRAAQRNSVFCVFSTFDVWHFFIYSQCAFRYFSCCFSYFGNVTYLTVTRFPFYSHVSPSSAHHFLAHLSLVFSLDWSLSRCLFATTFSHFACFVVSAHRPLSRLTPLRSVRGLFIFCLAVSSWDFCEEKEESISMLICFVCFLLFPHSGAELGDAVSVFCLFAD